MQSLKNNSININDSKDNSNSINLKEVIKFGLVLGILGFGWYCLVNYYIIPNYYTTENEIITFKCDMTGEIININKSEPYSYECGFIFRYGEIENVEDNGMDNQFNITDIGNRNKFIN